MARIVDHLPVEELEARYRASHDATEARHLQAIWLLAQGRTVLEVAEVLALVPRWVTQLAARYNAVGPEALLAGFARRVGAGRKRHIVLVLDNAGWHGPEGLAVPEGISLVFLPPYSPELQPAERLWPLVDEAVANRYFATLHALDAAVARRCRRLDPDTIRPHTDFHWWPRPATPH